MEMRYTPLGVVVRGGSSFGYTEQIMDWNHDKQEESFRNMEQVVRLFVHFNPNLEWPVHLLLHSLSLLIHMDWLNPQSISGSLFPIYGIDCIVSLTVAQKTKQKRYQTSLRLSATLQHLWDNLSLLYKVSWWWQFESWIVSDTPRSCTKQKGTLTNQ